MLTGRVTACDVTSQIFYFEGGHGAFSGAGCIGGVGNTGKLALVTRGAMLLSEVVTPWVAGSTTDAAPIQVDPHSYSIAEIGTGTFALDANYQWGILATLSGNTGDAAIPITCYLDNATSAGVISSAFALQFPTSLRLITRLRFGAPLGTGATPPTATLMKNGVATALTVALGAGAAAGANVVVTGAVLYADGDTFDVQVTQPISAEGMIPVVATLEGPVASRA